MLIPKIIREKYPDLTEAQVEEVRQQVVVDSVIKNGEVREVGDKRFIKMAEKFVNIDDLSINLIDSVNPFQRAFEVMSKSVTPSVLRIIQDQIAATRVEFSEEEALAFTRRSRPGCRSMVASARTCARRTRRRSGWPRLCSSCRSSSGSARRRGEPRRW